MCDHNKLFLGQIYNKKSNCANAQRVFCYKNKKKVVFISLFKKKGLFLPQDPEYVCTSKMVQSIAIDMGKQMKLWGIFNPFVSILKHCTTKGKKAFGDLYYEKTDSVL